MTVEVLLKISLTQEDNINTNLELRYLLVDTIEERGWATVVEEATGENSFELYLDIEEAKLENSKLKILELSKSLGFSRCNLL